MGQVNLISDTWDYIPRVVVREGNYQTIEQNRVVHDGPVSRGQSFLSADRVTQYYCRSANPNDPQSQMTDYRSNNNPIDGIEDWSLQ
jgi:hypothetical protein